MFYVLFVKNFDMYQEFVAFSGIAFSGSSSRRAEEFGRSTIPKHIIYVFMFSYRNATFCILMSPGDDDTSCGTRERIYGSSIAASSGTRCQLRKWLQYDLRFFWRALDPLGPYWRHRRAGRRYSSSSQERGAGEAVSHHERAARGD